MDNELIREKGSAIWETLTGEIISSIIGLASIFAGFFITGIALIGNVILILFGLILQIPIGYFKIYKIITGKQ